MSDRTRHTVEGDRTVSPAAGTGWWTTRRAMTIGGLSMFALCAFVLWKMPAQKPDKNALPEKPTLAFATQNPYKPPPADPPPPIQKVVAQPPPLPAAVLPPAPPDLGKAVSKESSSASGAPLFYSYAVPSLPDQFKPKKRDITAEKGDGDAPTTTAIAYKGQQIPGLKAGNMGDTTLMLPPGVVICTMSSVIESTVDGQFICTIQSDVKSPMGVVLLDAGSYIQGAYDVKVANGQRRLRSNTIAAWDLKTHCVVPLGGPMSDALGRAGQEGDYDPHTWEKLGAAGIILLSQSAMGLAQAALQSGNGNSYFQLNTGDMSSVANQLLRANMTIPPTITIHQGSLSGFWITQPIDFSSCYRVVPTER
jgi:type IV secretion system protein VirB10